MSEEVRSRPRITRVVAWAVATVAAGVVVWALPGTIRFVPDAPSGFWAMAFAALLVDIPLFGISQRAQLPVQSSLSVCFTFTIFVLWGAAPAIVVQAAAGAVAVIGRRYRPRAGLYFVWRLVCAAAAAELVVDLIEPRPITTLGDGLNGGDLLVFVMLALVWFAVSFGLLVVAWTTVNPRGIRLAARESRYDLLGTTAAVLVVSPLLATISGWWSALLVVPLLMWNRLSREWLRHEQHLRREPVSGLLNQRGLASGMSVITAQDAIAADGPRPFGVILVSVESVMAINRTLGRHLYEKAILLASRRMVDVYGEERVGRLSGEGIVLLLPDLTEADALAEATAAVRVLAPPVEVDGIPFALDPVGGVALSPRHGQDLGTLLMKAELAATEARRQSRPATVYIRRAEEETQRRVALLQELHTALREPARQHEVSVLYQPQIDLATNALSGVETLLRWNHPRWGPIPTDDLLAAVEPSEVMHLLTRHVLHAAAAQVRRWNGRGEPLRAAVNVSVADLHEPGFVDELDAMVAAYGIAPSQLVIEVTERTLITNMPLVTQIAGRLTRLGLGLSLDDFGTGHASLQQLRQLPLTEVKIDRSYVQGMADDPADMAIVTSVHQLARALGVAIVAEGVEDERTVQALAALPGTVGQGYYFGRPMTVDALDEWRHSR